MTELFKSIASPIVWVLALMILSLILTRRSAKRPQYRLGRCILFLGISILYLLSVELVSNALIYSLECRYELPSEEVLSNLDVIVILGGGMYASGESRNEPEAGGLTYSRLFSGVRIFKQSSARILVLSGGSPIHKNESEAEVMKALACELGIHESRIVTETKSRNTMEQAIKTAKLFSSTKRQRIGLVTSAFHMLRSEKAFRKQFPNDTVVPIPVNFTYSPDRNNLRSFIPCTDALSTSSCWIHEWIGIIWYLIRY